MNTATPVTPYEALGGAGGLHRLVDRFYALMHELPEAYAVRQLHPESLAGSAESLVRISLRLVRRPVALHR